MPQYLLQVSYTPESLAAQMKKPQDRVALVGKQLAKSGIKILAGGYSFGEYDITLIVEAGDDVTAAAMSIALGAGGALKAGKTTPLLNGAQWVAAMKKASSVTYTPAR